MTSGEDRRSLCVADRADAGDFSRALPSTVDSSRSSCSPTTASSSGRCSGRGGLDEDVIMKVIRANQQQIKACYEFDPLQKRLLGKAELSPGPSPQMAR